MSRRPVKHVLCYRGKRKCVSPMKVLAPLGVIKDNVPEEGTLV